MTETRKQDAVTESVKELHRCLEQAEAVVIGAGSGLSAAAGFTYSGKRFEEHFREFIEKYGMTDMYSAGFYPFASQEEKWAYWSRHIYYNRYDQPAGTAYTQLLSLVKERNYFVITTNVDHQFSLSVPSYGREVLYRICLKKFNCSIHYFLPFLILILSVMHPLSECSYPCRVRHG